MDLSVYPNVKLLDHPLLKHKISILRDKNTGTNEFRHVVKEIAVMEGYEALRDLPTEMVEIETPIEKTMQPMISGKKLCFVPILRAGLGMVDGMTELVPSAKVGHIGLYRDEVTHEPHEYYCKLPYDLAEREIYILDPMLATGGSAIDAITMLKKHGAKHMHFICIIAAPEGVKAYEEKFPEIPLYIGALDRQLNQNAYICPGLGDAGDRIFGTVK
ncbi:MAG: uracil phosphoribosyltransferase [Erysipelotrichaceae bacterium]|nr:uracil phosphoribosyltransferase [Erysipelotrichaceae bacterium]